MDNKKDTFSSQIWNGQPNIYIAPKYSCCRRYHNSTICLWCGLFLLLQHYIRFDHTYTYNPFSHMFGKYIGKVIKRAIASKFWERWDSHQIFRKYSRKHSYFLLWSKRQCVYAANRASPYICSIWQEIAKMWYLCCIRKNSQKINNNFFPFEIKFLLIVFPVNVHKFSFYLVFKRNYINNLKQLLTYIN